MDVSPKEQLRWICELRGVRDPCKFCHGLGRRVYSSTATWRGGIGGQALTYDVCDQCWGSGDLIHPGVDLRKAEKRAREATINEALRWLEMESGVSYMYSAEIYREIIKTLRNQKRRKFAEGVNKHNYYRAIDTLTDFLGKLAGAALERKRTIESDLSNKHPRKM